MLYASKVKSIEVVEMDTPIPVYDIEVPGLNNFVLANGLVVHNSKDIADGLAGAVYNASIQPDDASYYASEDSETIISANVEKTFMDDRQNILQNLVRKKPTYEELRQENTTVDEPDIVDPTVLETRISEDVKSEVQKLLSASKQAVSPQAQQPKQIVEPPAVSEQEMRRRFEEARRRRDGFSDSTVMDAEDARNGFIMF